MQPQGKERWEKAQQRQQRPRVFNVQGMLWLALKACPEWEPDSMINHQVLSLKSLCRILVLLQAAPLSHFPSRPVHTLQLEACNSLDNSIRPSRNRRLAARWQIHCSLVPAVLIIGLLLHHPPVVTTTVLAHHPSQAAYRAQRFQYLTPLILMLDPVVLHLHRGLVPVAVNGLTMTRISSMHRSHG